MAEASAHAAAADQAPLRRALCHWLAATRTVVCFDPIMPQNEHVTQREAHWGTDTHGRAPVSITPRRLPLVSVRGAPTQPLGNRGSPSSPPGPTPGDTRGGEDRVDEGPRGPGGSFPKAERCRVCTRVWPCVHRQREGRRGCPARGGAACGALTLLGTRTGFCRHGEKSKHILCHPGNGSPCPFPGEQQVGEPCRGLGWRRRVPAWHVTYHVRSR